MIEDLPGRYHEYLDRFAAALGDVKVGAFGKFGGRLIKKMSFEEFTPAYIEYAEILARYTDGLERGDTVNDMVLRILREQAATLVLEPPA